MKKFIITAIAMLSLFAANAQTQQTTTDNRQQETMTTEYKIISDEVVDGVRCVSAVPSGNVCGGGDQKTGWHPMRKAWNILP